MVDSESELAAAYEALRPRLVGIAYAMLGVRGDAEDVVGDCWFKLVRAHERDPIRDLAGWATVAVTRAALDSLRSARRTRESYVGPWLPEPIVTADPSQDPADRITLDDSVRFALLVLLESLTPAERTAWVMHDIFEMPFAEIAEVVGRSPQAVRQLARRARQHVIDGTPRVQVDAATHHRLVAAFAKASDGGDMASLVQVLDPAVVLTSDGGGVVSAARRPVQGPDRVARFVLGLLQKRENTSALPIEVNGESGLAIVEGKRLVAIVSLSIDRGLITRIDLVATPDKLSDVTIDGTTYSALPDNQR